MPNIISTGRGILVVVLTFASCLLLEISTEWFFDDSEYYQREAWPASLALTISGILCFLHGRSLYADADPLALTLYDEDGRESSHTLFFIRLDWCGDDPHRHGPHHALQIADIASIPRRHSSC